MDCGGPECDALGETCGDGTACTTPADCTGSAGCSGTMFTSAPACTGHVCTTDTPVDCSATGKVCDATSGCVACNAPADCPAPPNECVVNTCTAHVCGTQNLDQTHMASSGQSPGDCRKIVCNGSGSTTQVDDITDLPFSSTACQTNPHCDTSGGPAMPAFDNASPGTDCTGDGNPPASICGDGVFAGSCVQCNVDADCLAVNDAGTLACDPASRTCQ